MIRKDIIDQRILRDLSKNLEYKIIRDISDYVDLCLAADIDYVPATSELMTRLIKITAMFAAKQFDIAPNEFAQALGEEFLRAKQRQREAKENDA